MDPRNIDSAVRLHAHPDNFVASNGATSSTVMQSFACAIVPLKPNELRRPTDLRSLIYGLGPVSGDFDSHPALSSVNSQKPALLTPGDVDSSVSKCAFSRRNYAFKATCPKPNGTANRDCRPAAPAAASRWPIMALTDVQFTLAPTGNPFAVHFEVHSAAVTAPTSIGSPNAVPVP